MPARFMFLDNLGSPTRWGLDRYFDYLAKVRPTLPTDLQDLTAEDRYQLPSMSAMSLWHAGFTQVEIGRESILICAHNDYGTRRLEFRYSGVCKYQTTAANVRAMPSIVVQELVQLRNGILRHTFSHLGGYFTTIHARSVSFSDRPLH